MPRTKDLIEEIKKMEMGRSHWAKAVKEDAINLVKGLEENRKGAFELCECARDLKLLLLNGARSWKDYSYGACALVYDGDIARHYCTPSEYKRSKDGKWRPRRSVEWLDIQAEALSQAAALACFCFRELIKEKE